MTTTWKPYIFEGRDYLDARKINSWEDIVAQYPGVQIPRSELNKPYARENYQADEWSWPGWEPPPLYWPEWPPPYNPPGGGNPCEAEDECKYLGIVGPTVVDCGQEVWFKNVLVWEGCTLPPGTLMVGWSASAGEIRAVGVGARWRAPDCCDGTVVEICASGPGCQACIEVTLDCLGCCEDMELTGSDTQNAGDPWQGTVSPACPGATCDVTSNSGCAITCEINESGSWVQVFTDASDCGSFTVTVTKAAEGECAEESTSKTVRLDNGVWELCSQGGEGVFCNGPWCSSEWISGEDKINIWCKAGGMCARHRYYATTNCDGGAGPTVDCVAGCCDGCGTCIGVSYAYCAWSLWSWRCDGDCP